MNEFVSMYQALSTGGGTKLLGWFLANGVFSALVSTLTIRYLPYREWRERVLLWLLIFTVGVFIPLLGSPGVALAMFIGMRRQAVTLQDTFRSLNRLEFNPIGRKESGPIARGGMRARITQHSVPTEQRLQSIAALQHMPVMAASPLLRNLLDDKAEDIRLVAFGMLDKEEKKIAERIHALNQQPVPTTATKRYQREKQLAELYWELTYSGLVYGDLRSYTLTHALSHAESALAVNNKAAGVHFLAGRILNALGREEEAERRMHQAIELGIPKQRTQPYLAEFAFKRGDYQSTRKLLDNMHASQLTPHLQPVVDYWSQRGAA